ncbi:MAG: ATP-binding protein [Candidatus Aminicenantales bacterium]
MIYPRDLLNKIEPFLLRKEFISIVGPRQSGKTTFLEILKKYLSEKFRIKKELISSLTFEDRRLLAQFEADPVSFTNSYRLDENGGKYFLMIDEFQYAREGGQKLKFIYDTVKNIKIIVTGSSSLEIKARVAKFMVGRILSFHLYPFNFGEYLQTRDSRLQKIYKQNNEKIISWLFQGKPFPVKNEEDIFSEEMIRHYEDFCIWGGYPEVTLSRNHLERVKILGDIYNNYILKDIKTLLELATENNLYLLSQVLATQVGNIINCQNLGQASHLNYRQVKKHLQILKETFICQEVKPFFKNRQKELSKNPKIYFYDLGFRNNLLENMNSLRTRPDAGAIIENAVYIRLNELCEGQQKIDFWRTKSGAEVDFVLQIKGLPVPLEVKYSTFSKERLSRSLASFIESFKPESAVVLTKNYWGFMEKNKTHILFIPVYYI